AVALATERNDAVVVRPDRAALVGGGIVSGVVRGEGADAPAAPHIRSQQPPYDPLRPVRAGDAAPQQVAGVGSDRLDRALVRVEAEGVEADVLAPEGRLEALLQAGRLAPQLGRPLRLAQDIEDLPHPQPRVEHIALQLAQR